MMAGLEVAAEVIEPILFSSAAGNHRATTQ
jgi:hypothetical protein